MLHSKQRKYIALAAGSSALLILGLSVHLMSLRADYWALAEGHPSRLSDEGADMKLLFVGNSFIHYNGGAEAVVAELLQEALGIKVFARRYAPPGYTWQQHLADAAKPHSALHKLLAQSGTPAWDVVIFQEQSQAPALGDKSTRASLGALEGLVQQVGSRAKHIMLLMTWGYEVGDPQEHPGIFPDYPTMQERLAQGYVSLAASLQREANVSASVAPAGLGWLHIYNQAQVPSRSNSLPAGPKTFHALYAKDGIHPSPAGTYLEACTMASAVTGCRCSGLQGNPLKLSSAWQRLLQESADAAVFGAEAGAVALPPYPWKAPGCAAP